MTLRFLSSTNHGIVDYLAAADLIIAPFNLNLGYSNPMALWLSVISGFLVIIVSLATKYQYGAIKLIPFGGHLTLDLLVATFFMFVPLLFKLDGLDEAYYYINAAVVYLVVAVTESESAAITI
jgi:hypothetical protein